MKNLSLNTIISCLFFAALFTFVSCAKEDNTLDDQLTIDQPDFNFLETNAVLSNDVTVQNGILQFNTLDDFRSSLFAINQMTTQDRLQWEQPLGFKSMQTIFNDVVQAEFEQAGKLNSDLYTEKMQSGFIVNDELTGLYKLDVFNPAYSPVLNEQGLVMVENMLYHFDAQALKTWQNADINQVETLINATESTAAIQVMPIQKEEVILRNTSQWNDECSSIDGEAQMIVTASFFSDFMLTQTNNAIFVDYAVKLCVLIPNAAGDLEFDPNAVYSLRGMSQTDFTITNGSQEFVRVSDEQIDVEGQGGNYMYIPWTNGEFTLPPPYSFVHPARLMISNWRAYGKSSLGTNHFCQIAM